MSANTLEVAMSVGVSLRQLSDDDLVDLVDVALVLGAISAASEVMNQYQTWRTRHPRLQELAGTADETFVEFRRDLIRFTQLLEVADYFLDQISRSMSTTRELIDEADPEILSQIPFVTGYKARVRLRYRQKYREAVDDLLRGLRQLLGTLSEAEEIVARVDPNETREEILQAARVATSEHSAFKDAMAYLASDDATLGGAWDVASNLIDNAREYLGALRDQALGITDEAPSTS